MKCQANENTTKLIIHHKDGNPKNIKLENLMRLCTKCHTEYHSQKWSYTQFGLNNTHVSSLSKREECNIKNRMTQNQNIRLRDDVYLATKNMLTEHEKLLSGVIGASLTFTNYINDLAIDDLTRRGYYPPKENPE